jgi:hypothetical protein
MARGAPQYRSADWANHAAAHWTGAVVKTLISAVTGVVQNRTMFRPLSQDALILRRYIPNWAAPDDRKVNPWDLNEPDPTDNGTRGTFPALSSSAMSEIR